MIYYPRRELINPQTEESNMANKIVPKDELVNFVGTKVEPTGWYEVTQERINEFAHCTGDNYFMHVDVEKAKKTDLGGTIAHGLLTLSLTPYLMHNLSLIHISEPTRQLASSRMPSSA